MLPTVGLLVHVKGFRLSQVLSLFLIHVSLKNLPSLPVKKKNKKKKQGSEKKKHTSCMIINIISMFMTRTKANEDNTVFG